MEQKPDPILKGLSGLLEGRMTGLFFNLLIIVLLVLALLLPPVSAQDRILDAGYKAIDRDEGGSVLDPDGMQVTLSPAGLQENVKVKEESVPMASFMDGSAGKDLAAAASALPSNLRPKSPVYTIAVKGETPTDVTLTVPIPNNAEPYELLSLYNWTGERWEFVPSQVIVEDDVMEAHLDHTPRAVAVLQDAGQAAQVSAELPDYVSLPEEGSQALAELNPLGYTLGGDNSVEGTLPTLPALAGGESYRIVPTLRNWTADGVVRNDWSDNMLAIPESQDAHLAAIVDLVVREMYAGIDLDYRTVNPDLKAEYTSFVTKLAEQLHANGKELSVHVEQSIQISADRWETGAYDWAALGQAADRIEFPASQDPAAYAPGGQMDSLLKWAVGEVERSKLQPIFTAGSMEKQGTTLVERTYRDALTELSRVAVQQGQDAIIPGDQVILTLENLGVQVDPVTGGSWFTYDDEATGEERTVWLEDAGSLSHKLALVRSFNLGGITMRALWDEGNDPRVWDLVREYQTAGQTAEPPADSQFAVLWTVTRPDGQVQQETTTDLNQSAYTWTAPDQPGQYAVSAQLVVNNGQTVAGGEQVALLVELPTPTPTPTPSPTPIPTETPVPTPTPTPKPKPAATARPAGGTSSGGTRANPVNTNFGYGIQIDAGDDLGWATSAIKGMGFGWVKFQVPWKDFEGSPGAINWDKLNGWVNGLSNLKIMLSIVKAPAWARGGQDLSVEGPPNNPQDFANFLGQVAAHYCGSSVKAIEVWNEQNLHYEWGNKPISPAGYMELLKPAYTRIKQACPSMIVVSGALTPTGAPPPRAMDDYTYLEGMYKNGLKNYCDAVGAHPSGYNVAPSIKGGQAACDFITQQGSSFRGPCNTLHHSWSFNATLNGYHNIMVQYGDGNKKIWPTEFGWATDWIGDTNYGYAADNTRQEQADWTVQSYQLMKQWGFVGTAFLWNLNFKVTANGNECSQWGIVNPDRTGTATYNALKNMAK